MNLAIKPKLSDVIRNLAERNPDLDAEALAQRGGWKVSRVKVALESRPRGKLKSRVL